MQEEVIDLNILRASLIVLTLIACVFQLSCGGVYTLLVNMHCVVPYSMVYACPLTGPLLFGMLVSFPDPSSPFRHFEGRRHNIKMEGEVVVWLRETTCAHGESI